MKLFAVFLRGLFMGLCDVVPGISGGTIAFITGIYERLLLAIRHSILFPEYLVAYWRGKITKKIFFRVVKNMDLRFLMSLFFGIILALLAGSWLMSYLLRTYLVYTLSFFVGLIIASAVLIFLSIDTHHISSKMWSLLGLVFGFSLVFISPLHVVSPSVLFIILAGFLAVSALFLPGISGSFILLVLGMYEFMIVSLQGFVLSNILFFLIGAALGVIIISKIITYLFSVNKSATLYFLLGLVVGSLAIPLQRIYLAWEGSLVLLALALGILGLLIVLAVHFLSERA